MQRKGIKDPRTKICEMCNAEYHPVIYQYDNQKFCSKKCKQRKRTILENEKNIFKGGYSRETHIRLWVDAMGIADTSAPCHYCDKILYPNDFVIEHRTPRRKLNTIEAMKDISNLVVSCHDCNQEKGSMSYEEFKCLKN